MITHAIERIRLGESIDLVCSGLLEGTFSSGSGQPIPIEYTKKAYAMIAKITGVDFPNKRIKDRFDAESKDGSLKFSVGGGYNSILVIESDIGETIPNFDAVVAFLKKDFGDVYTRGQEYINARLYQEKAPETKVEVLQVLKPLPKMDRSIIKDTMKEGEIRAIIEQIRNGLKSRAVKVQGSPQFKVVKRGLTESILTYNDVYYVGILRSSFYQVKDVAEGNYLITLKQIESDLLRSLEVHSWKYQDFSNPNG